MRFLECLTESIALFERGENDRAALVCFGGNLLAEKVWSAQLDSDSLSRWRRIAFDLPGHGASKPSPRPEVRYSMAGYAELVKSLVSTLGLERVVLVGHSLGAHVALEAVASGCPEIVGAFIFGGPPLAGPQDIERGFRETPAMAYVGAAELSAEQAEHWAGEMVAPGTAAPAWMAQALLRVDPQARPLLLQSVGAGCMRDEVAALQSLARPAALVHGEHDALVDRDYLEGLSAPLWRDAVQIIEGAGHMPQVERPAEFNALLDDYAREVL